ncbi:MAG: hypothetical protein ACR2O4_10710 [Hyphomicrobiaceae bacterium]
MTTDVMSAAVETREDVVRDEDVLAMRRSFYEDGAISQFEAEKLIEREMKAVGESDAWAEFFIEALTDFVVNQMTPRGYVTEAQAQWLIDALSRDGQVNSHTELELLVNVVEEAIDIPECLSEFTLIQIGEAVLDGNGKLLGDAELKPGVIGDAEVKLLARVLYSAGGSNNIAVSRAEAEVLFDLNDATVEAGNCPAWSDLFVKAVANHLMAAQGYKALSRADAIRLNDWVNAPTDGVLGMFGKMFQSSMSDMKAAYHMPSDEERDAERLAQQIREIEGAEILTADEGQWVAARIGRDGILHENEKALLRFIKEEAPEIQSGLETLLAQV